MASANEDPNPAISAMQFLMRLQGGSFMADLQARLEEVAAGVARTGKAGEIDIKIKVEPVPQAANAIVFRSEVKDKVPKHAPPSDFYFVGDHGVLHTNDPRQQSLAFGPRPVPKGVDPETGEVLETRAS